MMLTQCAVLGAFGAPKYSLAFDSTSNMKRLVLTKKNTFSWDNRWACDE